MIPIKEEAKELHEETGVYENCVFCEKETKFWHDPTNSPVCEECAKEHTVKELDDMKALEENV